MTAVIKKNYRRCAYFFAAGMALLPQAPAFTPSQQPPESAAVPGNVVLALSVEFPTGNQISYTDAVFIKANRYDGYFDNRKCYTYSKKDELFQPTSAQNLNPAWTCPKNKEWSGNLLNWLTMTNLDQFRSVMTGGTRDSFSSMSDKDKDKYDGDTTDRTILIRSFGSAQGDVTGNNPIKNLIVGTPGMPLTGIGNKFARSAGYGSKFIVSNINNFGNLDATQQLAACKETPVPDNINNGNDDDDDNNNGNKSKCFNIRVEVCVSVPGVGLEANCKNRYTGVAKPEGLIQEYANNMRFAALGYLNHADTQRDGGVLRSAMKSVGPLAAIAGGGVVANPAPEWKTTTGVMNPNPDPAEATTSAVNNSGLINYLNKFGYSGGYETYDNVSELYYAAQLYLRGKQPPASYSNAMTAAMKDDFPVITGTNLLAGRTRDPIINSCQKNFIVGIGDKNTHCDGNLPGSTNTNCSAGTPTDDGLNVQNLWDITRGYEGMSNDGWVSLGGVSNGRTPYIAGLAHWANTNDIRPDLIGKQTISTYWVDVLEAGNGVGTVAAASLLKTPYWLAAKYGGFRTDMVIGDNPNTNSSSWDSNGDGVPDNWFAGSTPTLMKAGLSSAFANIALLSSVGSASSAAVTSNRQTSNSQILYAGYNPKGWTGSVRACLPTQTAAQCTSSPIWEASRWFKTTTPTFVGTPLTPATRKIFTSWRAASFSSTPFQWASLNAAQQAALNSTDGFGSDRAAYIRGNRAQENGLFRTREDTLLGDIVNSGVTYLSGSGPAYSGVNFSGHAAYRSTNKTRPPVVYVGANDGMLHAFSGTDGKELFGYVPGSVFSNLPSLTATNFQHKFFVDGTPMVGDIQKTATTWGTMLVGGLGAGGKGYYALDITNQSGFATSSENTLSALPMWEFTSAQDADLGFTFNEPSVHPVTGAYMQVAKVADSVTASGAWRVLVGNGYGSTSGHAALFLLDANTGSVSSKLIADGLSNNNGLSAPTPVDTDFDGLIDTIYAGDSLGNMHKFQFSKLSGSEFILAKPGAAGGGAWRYLGKIFTTGQPITTAPSVAPACDGNGWNVAFGTGKLNEDMDYADTATRGFYAVVDKNPSSALAVSSTDIVTIPLTTSTVSSSTVRNWTTPNLASKRGWKMDFTGGERVLSNSTLPPDTGAVLFGTTKPTGNVCTPGNTGFIMAVNLCTGKTGDLVIDGIQVGGIGINSTGVVKVSNTYTNSTNKQAVVCNQDGCKGPVTPFFVPTITPKGRYSWREILTK